MGLCHALLVRIKNFVFFFLIVILLPGLPPHTTFPFTDYTVTPPKELRGALERNYYLEGAERLLEGRVYGPECLIANKNEIYTGIHGGEIIKLTGNHVTHVTKIGQPCEDIYEEARCGRPLGMAFDTQGNNLIISDTYYGIWQVDLTNNKKKLLISPQQSLPGKEISRKAKAFNSVAVDKQGDIYWTDSSSDFSMQDIILTALANPSGRLFKYHRDRNVSEVLLDQLSFANGLVLSPAEDFIVVAETNALRLTKYYLKGPKAGQSEVFVDGLPGLPDNLTPDADGIWVPLVITSDNEHPSVITIFTRFPSIRLFLSRIITLFELPFRYLNSVYPNKVSRRFVHFIGHAESVMFLVPKRASILRVDWNGNIVGSLHGFDRSVGAVSHVLEFNDYLYLGSPFNRFLARVKSPKAAKQPQVKIKNVRVEGVSLKPAVQPSVEQSTTVRPTTTTTATTRATTTTTPRPTTTTAEPTTTITTTTPRPTTVRTTVRTTTKKPVSPENGRTTRVPPKKPAPVQEDIPVDTKPPKLEKLKVINKQGTHVEL